jgi:DNA-binding FadR family transcriptional regulator
MDTAERIYVASTSGDESKARLTEALARRIEDDIAALGLAAGTGLGSLRELSERYGAGRSAMREAVGLLERRGLGRLRPGPCGGFILTRPQSQATAAALSEHFLASGTTPGHVADAREALQLLTASPAADAVRAVLGECLDHVEAGLRGDAPAAVLQEAIPARGAASTRAVSIARTLAGEILVTRKAGTRLGSEWDLCDRFGVSRLTLRQAIRLLQDSGLVECRRGRGNGLLIRERRATGSMRLLLAYLIGERLDPMDAGTILFLLNAYVPALAVARAGDPQCEHIEAALARVEGRTVFDRYDLLALVHCISRFADSPIIDLYSRCLVAFEARFRTSLTDRLPAAAQVSYFRLIRRLLDRRRNDPDDLLRWAKRESAACLIEMSQQRPI